MASCYTLLVSHSCVFSHNPLLIIKRKPRFLAMVYKTTINLIFPCLSDFFFLCHLFLHCMFKHHKRTQTAFFQAYCSLMACLLLPTPLCFFNTLQLSLTLRMSHSTDEHSFQYSAHISSLSHNNNYDTNHNANLPPSWVFP